MKRTPSIIRTVQPDIKLTYNQFVRYIRQELHILRMRNIISQEMLGSVK